MERIGIYGGSFNPPHLGHIRAAAAALEKLKLDKLLLIPAGTAPHKTLPEGSPTPQQRLEMVKIAAAGEPRFLVSDMEIRQEGLSYTYLTVEALRKQYPHAQLVLLMGTDMFLCFSSWKNPEKITREASLGVFYRGDADEVAAIDACKAGMQAAGVEVSLVKNPVTEISSTQIRRMLVFGCAGEFLDPGVEDYIRKSGLYGTSRSYQNLTEEELEKAVTGLLKQNRVAHVLGCRDTARELARRWNADENDAVRAALLHDITKALDGPLQLTLCKHYDILLDTFSTCNPKTLHALTGSLVAERIFGENPAVVSAICSHTTGKANMTTLEKIIYVADYMEPTRSFEGVEELRYLAFTDLDGALKLGLEMTLEMLKKTGREISPASQEALAYLNRYASK